jgi:hypothetical protein
MEMAHSAMPVGSKKKLLQGVWLLLAAWTVTCYRASSFCMNKFVAALHTPFRPYPILYPFSHYSLCSAELISTVYQPWNSVFLSQQNSHSRLIS